MDVTSYLLGKKSSGGGGGDTHDWSQIGYNSKPTTLVNIDDEIYNNSLIVQNNINQLENKSSAKISNTIPNDIKPKPFVFPNYNFNNLPKATGLFQNAFTADYGLIEIPKIQFSYATTLYQMCQGCYLLKKIDVSGINTTEVTRIDGAFQNCQSLETIDINSFNCPKVTTMANMFYGDLNLETIVMNNVTTSSALTAFNAVFQDCKKLKTLDISSLNTKNVTNFNSTFYHCTTLQHITFGNNFSFESATNLSSFINDCPSLDNDTLNAIMGYLAEFTGTKTLKYVGFSDSQATTAQTLSNWSTLSSNGWTTGY